MAQTISAAAKDLLRTGGLSVPVVEVWHGINKKATLNVTDCDTTYDGTGAIPRTCSMTLAGFDALIPETGSLAPAGTYADTSGTYGDGPYGDNVNRQIRGLVIPGVSEVRLFDRLTLPDGTTEDVSGGRFRVDTVSFNHTAQGVEARITGLDVARRVAMAGYTSPYLVARGTNVETALKNLLTNRVGSLAVTTPVTTYTTPRLAFLPVSGANPWEDAKRIAYSAGWELTTDRSGGVTAFVPPDPGSGTAVWDITEATLVSAGTSLDDQDAVNTIVVNGQTAEDAPVRGVAEQLNGQWGVNSIGRRTRYEDVEHVNSTTQANLFAHGLLRKHMGLIDTITVEVPFLPHLDQWDLVDVTDRTLDLEDTTYRVVRVQTNRRSFRTTLTLARRLA